MRIVDVDGNAVISPDLVAGYLVKETAIRVDADQIDDIKKFAWADGDYEDVLVYRSYSTDEREAIAAAEKKEAEREELISSAENRLSLIEAAQLDIDEALVAIYESKVSKNG